MLGLDVLTNTVAPKELLLMCSCGLFPLLKNFFGQYPGSSTWVPHIKYPMMLLFPLDRGKQ